MRIQGLVFLVLAMLLGAAGARAGVYDVTFINVTFSQPCVGGSGTCTEVVNGSGLYDTVTDTAWDLSVQLTGSYAATLDGFVNHLSVDLRCPSGSASCFGPDFLYDLSANPAVNPIQFAPNTIVFSATTPAPLTDAQLYIPSLCGGDQVGCGATGMFPVGADFNVTSGTYTAVAVTPEPSFVIVTCFGMAGLLLSRRMVKRG